MTSDGSKSRIKWEGDSNQEIRSWPKDVRQNFGLELTRLDNHEEPLDSRPMGAVLPGVHELRDRDKDFWYRLFYHLRAGWIYVLHCFTKKTNQTSKSDIKITNQRLSAVKLRNDAPAEQDEDEDENEDEKSA